MVYVSLYKCFLFLETDLKASIFTSTSERLLVCCVIFGDQGRYDCRALTTARLLQRHVLHEHRFALEAVLLGLALG